MNQIETSHSTASPAPGSPATGLAPDAPRFAFVQAGWHADVVARGRAGFLDETARLSPQARVAIFDAPGAFETPLIAQRLARSGRFDAVIVCAFIVDGAIYRHDFVARAVVEALMRIGLESDVPVISIALTPHQVFHAEADHAAFFRAHFENKGKEGARAALAAVRRVDAA